MSINKTLLILCIFLGIIGALHFSGIYLHLYWRLPVFDTFVHFLGGAWVAMVVLAAVPYVFVEIHNKKNLIMIVLSMVLIVGILWEIFEVIIGFSVVNDSLFIKDTITDLCADLFGGAVVLIAGAQQLILWNQKKQQ